MGCLRFRGMGWWWVRCVVGRVGRSVFWVLWLRCGRVVLRLIGVCCLGVLVRGVWGCLLMLFSGSGFGWMLGWVWVMWLLLVCLRLVIRCWVRWLSWLMVGSGCLLGVCRCRVIRGFRIMRCWVVCCCRGLCFLIWLCVLVSGLGVVLCGS